MELGLGKRTALVTGGSRGIGLAIASELATEGVRVAIVARDHDRLRRAAASMQPQGEILPIAADCRNAADIDRAVAEAEAAFGRIDILVNNAGETPMGTIASVDDETWQRSLDLKLMGYVRLARAVLPAMRRQGWGRVVNIVGRTGRQPLPDYIAGSTINAALLSFTKALAREVAPDGVLVNAVNPGPIATDRWREVTAQRARLTGTPPEEVDARAVATVPLGRLGRPEEIAAAVAFLCSERAGYIAGAFIDIDGGSTASI